MSDDNDKGETSSDGAAQPEPNTRKLKITKRVLRHFNVRSGLLTGRPFDDGAADVDGYRLVDPYVGGGGYQT